MKPARKLLFATSFMLMYALLTSFTLATEGAAKKHDGLSIRLISDHSIIEEGKPFLLGLHIKHEKGYHTYWKNPGLVGLATRLKWTLPAGFKTSAVSWPYPEMTTMAGNPCYGYERDVTLYITVTPPEKLSAKKLTVSLDATWMCCAKNCFPGSGTLTMALPIGSEARLAPNHSALFSLAKQQTPLPYPDSKIKLLSSVKEKWIRLQIVNPTSDSLDQIYLYSEDGQISSAEKQIVNKQADGSCIITAKRCDFSPKKISSLPAVLKMGEKYYRIDPTYTQGD
jgi:thiol:disulfide interchange protein DsbD